MGGKVGGWAPATAAWCTQCQMRRFEAPPVPADPPSAEDAGHEIWVMALACWRIPEIQDRWQQSGRHCRAGEQGRESNLIMPAPAGCPAAWQSRCTRIQHASRCRWRTACGTGHRIWCESISAADFTQMVLLLRGLWENALSDVRDVVEEVRELRGTPGSK